MQVSNLNFKIASLKNPHANFDEITSEKNGVFIETLFVKL